MKRGCSMNKATAIPGEIPHEARIEDQFESLESARSFSDAEAVLSRLHSIGKILLTLDEPCDSIAASTHPDGERCYPAFVKVLRPWRATLRNLLRLIREDETKILQNARSCLVSSCLSRWHDTPVGSSPNNAFSRVASALQ